MELHERHARQHLSDCPPGFEDGESVAESFGLLPRRKRDLFAEADDRAAPNIVKYRALHGDGDIAETIRPRVRPFALLERERHVDLVLIARAKATLVDEAVADAARGIASERHGVQRFVLRIGLLGNKRA